MYCTNCGAKIAEYYKYCQKCGKPVLEKEVTSKPMVGKEVNIKKRKEKKVSKFLISVDYPPGSLFDINRTLYVFKDNLWDLGSSNILDEEGKVIGRIRREILNIRRKVEIEELDGTVPAILHSKIVAARQIQDLKDSQGKLIARIRKKLLSFFQPSFFFDDPYGNRWYEAQGEFLGGSFSIIDFMTGKKVATIEKTDKSRENFPNRLSNFEAVSYTHLTLPTILLV